MIKMCNILHICIAEGFDNISTQTQNKVNQLNKNTKPPTPTPSKKEKNINKYISK